VTLGAVLLVALAVALWIAKQFFGEGVKHVGQRFWPAVFGSRRRTFKRRELRRYRASVAENYDSHSLGFLNTAVKISDVYVPLQHEEGGQRVDIYQSVRSRPRAVVLGAAGAGKSMLLKSSMVRWAREPSDFERVPVFVELFRSNRGDGSLRDLIVDAFRRNGIKNPDGFLDRALDDGLLSVFFDGFDEIVTDRRSAMAHDMKKFAEDWPNCQVVVTCRDAVYDFELRPAFDHEVRVAGFDDAAIRRFLKLWFLWTQPERDARYEVEQLMVGLRASPAVMLLARTPLMLTMIVSLHDADPGIGPVLPNSRAEFYKVAVEHLLRRDHVLGRHDDRLARYKSGHKLMALRTIALTAQGAMAPGTDRRTVSEDELIECITRVLSRFNLEASHAPELLSEIVDRSGLLVKVDEENLLYEFPHLTLQEYLAAMELADNPDRLLSLYKENPDRWRETVKLWCGGANRDCTEIVSQLFAGNDRDKLLALECLPEAKQIDESLANKILYKTRLGDNVGMHLVAAALGAVAADPGPRGTALFAHLRQVAQNDADDYQTHAIAVLAFTRLRAAVETLSDLSTSQPVANAALRAMGELAVPVLAERARTGSVEAVDDIAAIGSASAGLALAELLWADEVGTRVTMRAAWQLAILVGSPDVEEELRRADIRIRLELARDDWLWEPFTQDGSEPIGKIMGRVGFLILNSDVSDIPDDISGIDLRLALPIGVIRGAARPRPDSAYMAELEARITAIARSHRINVTRFTPGELLAEIQAKDPAIAGELTEQTLIRDRIDSIPRRIMHALPTQILVEIAKQLLTSGENFRVDQQDWQTINENPPERVIRDSIAADGALMLFFGPYLLGITRATGTAFQWWPWGPAWLSWATITAFAVMLIGYVAFFTSEARLAMDKLDAALLASLGRTNDSISPWLRLATIGAGLSFPGAVILGVRTLVGWIYWPILLAGVIILFACARLLTRVAHKRMRWIHNPFRPLLKLDESMIRIQTTVISQRDV
jgi:hypothetical protein